MTRFASQAEADAHFMRLALDEAQRGRGSTHPNPMVGSVIVCDGQVVASGFHERAGLPHAEVMALRAAGDRVLHDCTIYVTLEPCSHHGRTPPCADAVINAGFARVVCGMIDPNPLVGGRGVERIRAAGIDVTVGVLEAECRALNEAFITAFTLGRPWVSVKIASSLDGRIATRTGNSQWITGPDARLHGHTLRASHDAILVGSGTLHADRPRLTARIPGQESRQPHRYAIDTRLRISDDAPLLDTTEAPTTLICGPEVPEPRLKQLQERGIDVQQLDADHSGVSIAAILALLMRRGQLSLLIEGGATLAGSFFDAQVVDRLWLYQAPIVIGGRAAAMSVAGVGIDALSEAVRARHLHVQSLGDDILIRADFRVA
jgi:diaminohydroxyphosphoribosylaminopyrimidine deaminase / 5-amino-6-(5-phosphoribosylamino)uracil reductase